MLPGLQTTVIPDLIYCATLDQIKLDFYKNKIKKISEYNTKNCNEECNEHHSIVYLEYILEFNIVIEKEILENLLKHGNSKIRNLALVISYKLNFDDIIPESMQDDPDYNVRYVYLQKSKKLDTSLLIKQTRDVNTEVITIALDRLINHKNANELKTEILNVLCYCITHRKVLVREKASKYLNQMSDIPGETKKLLFSKQIHDYDNKKISGAIVYGLEDEYLEVRKNTIISLYSLISHDVFPQAFEFLVDTLNDENEELRELCTCYLKKLSENYVLRLDIETTTQVCGSFEEKSKLIKNNILNFLSNVLYTSTEIYKIIVSHINKNIDSYSALMSIKKIVKKNSALFFDNLSTFYKYTNIAEVEKSLSDNAYLSKLVVLKALQEEGYTFKVQKVIKEHFNFLEILEAKKTPRSNVLDARLFKKLLCNYIDEKTSYNNIEKKYSSIFKIEDKGQEAYNFLKYLYNCFSEYFNTGRTKKFGLIYHRFLNAHFNMSFIKSKEDMKAYVQELNLSDIKPLRYQINAPSVLYLRPNIPINLKLYVFVDVYEDEELKVKVWDPKNMMSLFYPLKKCIPVYILANDTKYICCAIIKVLDKKEIRLSKTKTIEIRRKIGGTIL